MNHMQKMSETPIAAAKLALSKYLLDTVVLKDIAMLTKAKAKYTNTAAIIMLL